MAEFIFLGANCSSQDLDNGNTSLLVKGTDGACVLVDVSCNLALPVDACADVIVLTHEHIDHVYALYLRCVKKVSLSEGFPFVPFITCGYVFNLLTTLG